MTAEVRLTELTVDSSPSLDSDIAPGLDKDSPEYKAYYQQRFKAAAYQQIAQMIERYDSFLFMRNLLKRYRSDPTCEVIRYWLSWDEAKRATAMEYFTRNLKFKKEIDLDDTELVDRRAESAVICTIVTVAWPEMQKDALKDYGKLRKPNLLRTALQTSSSLKGGPMP
ncbi:hypothetical protein BDZ97DRAFT_1201317 [Flammula alnicola]|nr:hypothetical protein BDZ97DRAFT_1201317 [Flammula alnicola]